MNYDYQPTPFSKAVITGLFAGLTATMACLAYGYFYRLHTGFTLSTIINVPSIIIGSCLVSLVCGMLYYALRQAFAFGNVLFIVLFAGLTLFCAWKASGVVRSPEHLLTVQFRGLLTGMVIIIGSCVSFGIPFYTQSKKFAEMVL